MGHLARFYYFLVQQSQKNGSDVELSKDPLKKLIGILTNDILLAVNQMHNQKQKK